MEKLEMYGESMPLNKLLKYNSLSESGGQAKHLIQEGYIKLNGQVCTIVRKQIRPGDIIDFDGQEFEVVEEAEL